MSGYEQYAEGPSSGQLAALNGLVTRVADEEAEVARLEAELKDAKGRLRGLIEHDIPDLMDEAGVADFTTLSGHKVKIRKTVRCSIPPANKSACMRWLDERGHGGMIKREVAVAFRKDQEEAAGKLADELQGTYENVKTERRVEPSTLRSFIMGQLEEGAEFPMEMFGAFLQRFAKVTAPKE